MPPTIPVPVTVHVPAEAEREARRRARHAGEPENVEDYLIDLVDLEFDFRLAGADPESDFLRSPGD